MVIKANKNDFDQLIHKERVLVDFFADWCGDCRALQPNFEKASDAFNDVAFVAADVDAMPELREKYQIGSIPTTIYFEHGVEKRRHVDFMTIDGIAELIK